MPHNPRPHLLTWFPVKELATSHRQVAILLEVLRHAHPTLVEIGTNLRQILLPDYGWRGDSGAVCDRVWLAWGSVCGWHVVERLEAPCLTMLDEIPNSRSIGSTAAHKAVPRRRTHRKLGEGGIKDDALAGQTVEIRRDHLGLIVS